MIHMKAVDLNREDEIMADNYTLWNLPKEKRNTAKRDSGLSNEVRHRIERLSNTFQADNISDRLKPFEAKIDDASFFGCRS
ncbi:MAG: hypothetical protein RQ867_06245 [Mariprofundaceae bacterium]|nr:hypothetical protein [Mariprofundaceae bacterium]